MDTCPFCASSLPVTATTCPTCGASLGGLQLRAGTGLRDGKYVVERPLGQGGFGITYLAQDTQLARPVAIKELFPEGSSRQGLNLVPPPGMGADGFRETLERFLDEGRTLAQFNHKSIVRVFDAFTENATAYLVMEALQGHTLEAEIDAHGKLEPNTVKVIAEHLSDALEVVHQSGLLHRDVKPANVFLTDDGRTVLIDFGSARAFVSSRTVQHTRLVSAGYAAPEQYASQAKFGPYTDVYGLSATLYHALTGQAPPSATDRLMGQSLALRRIPTDGGWQTALTQGLEVAVGNRFASTRAFMEAFEQSSSLPSPTRPPKRQKAMGAVNERVVYRSRDLTVTDKLLTVGNRNFHLNQLREVSLDEEPGRPSQTASGLPVVAAITGVIGFALVFSGDTQSILIGVISLLVAGLTGVMIWTTPSAKPPSMYCLTLEYHSGHKIKVYRDEDRTQIEEIIRQISSLI